MAGGWGPGWVDELVNSVAHFNHGQCVCGLREERTRRHDGVMTHASQQEATPPVTFSRAETVLDPPSPLLFRSTSGHVVPAATAAAAATSAPNIIFSLLLLRSITKSVLVDGQIINIWF